MALIASAGTLPAVPWPTWYFAVTGPLGWSPGLKRRWRQSGIVHLGHDLPGSRLAVGQIRHYRPRLARTVGPVGRRQGKQGQRLAGILAGGRAGRTPCGGVVRAEQPGQVRSPVIGYLPEQQLLERPAGPGQGGQDPQPAQPGGEQPTGVEQQAAQARSVLPGPDTVPGRSGRNSVSTSSPSSLRSWFMPVLAQRFAGLGVAPPRLHLVAPVPGSWRSSLDWWRATAAWVGVAAGPGQRGMREHHVAGGELLGHPAPSARVTAPCRRRPGPCWRVPRHTAPRCPPAQAR